jgi:hypothetical protein
MGCNCGKKEKVIQNPKTVKLVTVDEREPTKEEISMVDDWYNNLDTIEPIKDKDEDYPLIHD